MNAKELFHKDGTSAGVWYCGECKYVRDRETDAEACCKPRLCKCGQPTGKYRTNCEACELEKMEQNERERFEKATKLTPDQYDGPVHSGGESYWSDYSEFLDMTEPSERPEYVYACTTHPCFNLDVESAIENATGYVDWDGFDPNDCDGKEELAAAISKFNEANKERVYWTGDSSRVILVPESDRKEEA